MKKIMFRTAQAFCLMAMAAFVGSVFTSCEKDKDEEGRPYYSKYLDINVYHCERIGSVLAVDYTVANKSDGIQTIEFFTPVASDNVGGTYTEELGGVTMAFGNSEFWQKNETRIASKDTIVGHMKVRNFNPQENATTASVKISIGISGIDLADKPFEQNRIAIIDKRVKEHGVQTNDTLLAWKVISCAFNENDVDLHFTVTNNTGQRLSNFGMGYMKGGEAVCQDNLGLSYESSICFEGGEWYHNAEVSSLAKGGTVNGTIRVKDVRENASELTVIIGATATNYIVADEQVRFLTIPIEK